MCSRTAHTLTLFNLVFIPVPGEHFCFYGRFIQVPGSVCGGKHYPEHMFSSGLSPGSQR